MFQEFKKWTPEEVVFLKENNKAMTPQEMSTLLNRSASSIENKRFKLGLMKNTVHPEIQIGQRFERLVVLKVSDKKGKNGNIYFTCICDCGKIKEISGSNLRLEQTKSCGCYFLDKAATMNRGEPKEVSFNCLEGLCKASARVRGLFHSLMTKEFRWLIQQNCFWCEKEPAPYNVYFTKDGKYYKAHHKEWADQQWINVNGIDRVNSDTGYVINNCVPSCTECNYAKRDKTIHEWLTFIERFQPGFTVKMLEKLEKFGITIPPKK